MPGSALVNAWREGYTLAKLKRDVMAGLTIGVVAVPLSMALAIATGVPPQHGLYTAIVAAHGLTSPALPLPLWSSFFLLWPITVWVGCSLLPLWQALFWSRWGFRGWAA